MGLEAASFISDLVSTNPTGADGRSEGDDHIRLLKVAVQACFPGFAGRWKRVVAKGAGFTLALNDNASIFRPSVALVALLPAVATMGNGWSVVFYNDSLFAVTITPNGTERINGVNASVTVPPGCIGTLFGYGLANAEWLFTVAQISASNSAGADITGNITLGTVDINGGTRRITASAIVTLPAVANVPLGARLRLKSVTTGDVTWVPNAAETADGVAGAQRIPSYKSFTLQANATDWIVVEEPDCVVGELKMISAGVSAPKGWALADFSAISRTTFAGLFAVTSTVHGVGDGSTTFNVFDSRSRSVLGDGTSTVVEVLTTVTAAANAVAIASNADHYITGKQVVVTGASGFTGLVNGTFFIIRVDATHISFASSLTNAQRGTVVTVTGTGNATLTTTHSTRTVGQRGGEETHLITRDGEMPQHFHTTNIQKGNGGGGGDFATGVAGATDPYTSDNKGGVNAMNITGPYGVARFMVKT